MKHSTGSCGNFGGFTERGNLTRFALRTLADEGPALYVFVVGEQPERLKVGRWEQEPYRGTSHRNARMP